MTGAATTTHTPRRRPGRPKGGGLLVDRAQLVAAAERAITSIGPDVTMDQIAAEANVTKPILYRTIGNRAAVIDVLSDVLVERIGSAIAAAPVPDGGRRDVFVASVRAYLEAVVADRNLYVFVNSAGQQTRPLRARIDRSARQLVEAFGGDRATVGSSMSPLTWGHSIVGALQTVTLMWIDAEDLDARTIDDVAADITHLLWPGVAEIFGVERSRGD